MIAQGYFDWHRAIPAIALAISSGARIKSIHPLAIALDGMRRITKRPALVARKAGSASRPDAVVRTLPMETHVRPIRTSTATWVLAGMRRSWMLTARLRGTLTLGALVRSADGGAVATTRVAEAA